MSISHKVSVGNTVLGKLGASKIETTQTAVNDTYAVLGFTIAGVKLDLVVWYDDSLLDISARARNVISLNATRLML